jgi:hypothetical protein
MRHEPSLLRQVGVPVLVFLVLVGAVCWYQDATSRSTTQRSPEQVAEDLAQQQISHLTQNERVLLYGRLFAREVDNYPLEDRQALLKYVEGALAASHAERQKDTHNGTKPLSNEGAKRAEEAFNKFLATSRPTLR